MSIKLSKESVTTVNKFAKARGLKPSEAADKLIHVAGGRVAALENYNGSKKSTKKASKKVKAKKATKSAKPKAAKKTVAKAATKSKNKAARKSKPKAPARVRKASAKPKAANGVHEPTVAETPEVEDQDEANAAD